MISIQQPTADDAAEIAALLVRSIREICGPDYDNDEALLAAWCANKTPETIARWIANPDLYIVIARDEEADRIAGVASLHITGEIPLCYLLPEYLKQGIGTMLLEALIRNARVLGLNQLTLESTRTARRFYERNGFQTLGEVRSFGTVPAFKMRRDLRLDNYA